MRIQVYQKPVRRNYFFRLKAKNGWPYLTSIPFRSKKEATDHANYFKRISNNDNRFERKVAKNGKHYYEIIDEKKAAMAVSRFYSSIYSMERAIGRIQKHASSAPIVEKKPLFVSIKAKKTPEV